MRKLIGNYNNLYCFEHGKVAFSTHKNFRTPHALSVVTFSKELRTAMKCSKVVLSTPSHRLLCIDNSFMFSCSLQVLSQSKNQLDNENLITTCLIYFINTRYQLPI